MSRTLFNVGWRYLLRHPWQTVLMIVGITLGVAVMVAIDLANSAASRAFDLSTETIAGRATHQIDRWTGRAGRSGLCPAARGRHGHRQRAGRDRLRHLARSSATGRSSCSASIPSPRRRSARTWSPRSEQRGLGSAEPGVDVGQLVAFLTRPGALLISEGLAAEYGLQLGDCSRR